jgi:hypothetical protein
MPAGGMSALMLCHSFVLLDILASLFVSFITNLSGPMKYEKNNIAGDKISHTCIKYENEEKYICNSIYHPAFDQGKCTE